MPPGGADPNQRSLLEKFCQMARPKQTCGQTNTVVLTQQCVAFTFARLEMEPRGVLVSVLCSYTHAGLVFLTGSDMSFSEAAAACAARSASLTTEDQLERAHSRGMSCCVCGWLQGDALFFSKIEKKHSWFLLCSGVARSSFSMVAPDAGVNPAVGRSIEKCRDGLAGPESPYL